MNIAKILRRPFLKNTSGGCYWVCVEAILNLGKYYWKQYKATEYKATVSEFNHTAMLMNSSLFNLGKLKN